MMTIAFLRHAFGRALCVLLGVATAFGVGAALDARQARTPPAGEPTTPQQTPAPAGRNNAAAQGAVRDASGAIIGFTGLAEIPGTPWRIHDAARPHPRVITPGATPGSAPSDAIVLFDGKDLSKWVHSRNGQLSDAQWPVKEGYFETGAGTGSILTREKFGDVQLHVEFATPSPGRGASQDRGNSGVRFMGLYEVWSWRPPTSRCSGTAFSYSTGGRSWDRRQQRRPCINTRRTIRSCRSRFRTIHIPCVTAISGSAGSQGTISRKGSEAEFTTKERRERRQNEDHPDSLFAVDHPGYAELIDKYAKTDSPRCFLEGHLDRSVFRQSLKNALCLQRIIDANQYLETLRLFILLGKNTAAH